ncbi:MAG: flavin reductase family protein [archaeon]
MKKVDYNEYFSEASSSLSKGAFLTVKNNNELNTMTIGWATIGIIWGKPVLMVMVRKSRYTYNLIENTGEFSVSFAFGDKMKKELNFCGTRSGRNYDKFEECSLITVPGDKIDTPLIKNCDLHYECKIRFKQAMNKDNLVQEFDNKFYGSGDYHTLYFGEIVNTFLEKN